MTRADNAVELFRQGFSCSQAVLGAFAGDFALEQTTAFRIYQGFGTGIAYSDEICGAVSGAIMVIGLRFGRTRADDIAARDKTYAVVTEFLKEFAKRNGSTSCTRLIGYNLSVPEQAEEAKAKKAFISWCPVFVRSAAEVLEGLV
jgi:C_GCAxxG_C_C family probable redox protein